MNLLDRVSCSVLPGKFPNGLPVPDLYNDVYRFWRSHWKEVFTRVGSPESLSAENFLRQDVILVLHRDGEIAGLVTKCVFNLAAEPTFDHFYLKPFPGYLKQALHDFKRGVITTEEYLSVHPDFSKRHLGFSLGEVLIGLGLKVFLELNAQITLGTSVRPAKVFESASKFGYVEAGRIEKYGLDCSLIYNTQEQLKTHPDPQVSRLIDTYWLQRRDYTGILEPGRLAA